MPVVVLAVLMGSTAALFQEDAGMRFAALMARDRMDAIAMQADPPTGGKNNTSECLNGFCLDSVGKYGDMTVLELDPFSTDWVEPRDDTVYALINAPEQPNNPQLKAHLGDGYLRNIKNLGGSWYFVNYNHYGG